MSRRRSEAGFSLVEVILALALLGAVLISVSGLFVLGARQVASGRDYSVAVTAARDIVEQMNLWSYRDTWQAFGSDGSVSAARFDSRSNALASQWEPALRERLAEAHAEIAVLAVPQSSAPTLRDARAVRVEVTVHWSEGQRARSVRLAMVRM